MTSNYVLTEDAKKRTHALASYLRELITQQDGRLSFATFMETVLYHPTLGYYCAADFTLGAQGDFTTAPEISPLFAQCFVTPYREICAALGNACLLEIGAGSGHFAQDFLLHCESLDCLPTTYFIYEISASLRAQQRHLLAQACPHLLARVTWLENLPDSFSGMIVANEVLDAFPVHLFHCTTQGVKEKYVCWENDHIQWQLGTPSTPLFDQEVNQLVQRYALPAGYSSEINLHLAPWLKKLAHTLKQGVLFVADYGYGQKEFYHSQRNQGTLCCFFRHQKNNNPLTLIGLQDITAHVDFTRVAETALLNECRIQGYTTQAAFLVSNGLVELAEKAAKNKHSLDQFRQAQALKLLTLPTEMGELIKIMALSKNVELSLKSFTLLDKRRDL
jgi:SAM-dependent MidA family methyltransferase